MPTFFIFHIFCLYILPRTLFRIFYIVSFVCREGNEPGDQLAVTYKELLQSVCRFANVLKSQGAFTMLLPPAGQLPYRRSHTSAAVAFLQG